MRNINRLQASCELGFCHTRFKLEPFTLPEERAIRAIRCARHPLCPLIVWLRTDGAQSSASNLEFRFRNTLQERVVMAGCGGRFAPSTTARGARAARADQCVSVERSKLNARSRFYVGVRIRVRKMDFKSIARERGRL